MSVLAEEARQRLLASLSPELVEAIETLVAETVAQRLGAATPDTGSPWMSKKEGAAYLGVGVRTIERWIERGRLKASPFGSRVLLHRDELDKAATREDVAPTTPPRRR